MASRPSVVLIFLQILISFQILCLFHFFLRACFRSSKFAAKETLLKNSSARVSGNFIKWVEANMGHPSSINLFNMATTWSPSNCTTCLSDLRVLKIMEYISSPVALISWLSSPVHYSFLVFTTFCFNLWAITPKRAQSNMKSNSLISSAATPISLS